MTDLRTRGSINNEILQLVGESLAGAETHQSLLARITSNLAIDPNITAQVEVAAEVYNEAVCRLVGIQMRDKLPHEVRDMVYEYLVPDEVFLCAKSSCCRVLPLHVHDYSHDDDDSDSIANSHSDDGHDSDEDNENDDSDSDHESGIEECHDECEHISSLQPYIPTSARTKGDLICPEHYWRDHIIGAENARELIEAFYRTSTFIIEAESIGATRPETIPSVLLGEDRFGIGLSPIQYISHVRLELDVRGLAPLPFTTYFSQRWEIPSWIKSLGKLKQNARVEVSVCNSTCFLHYNQNAGILNKAMELMLPELVSLRRAGYRLVVKLGQDWYGELTSEKKMLAEWLDHMNTEAGEGEEQLASE